MTDILQFDPDKFILTKKDFLQILNNIGERWTKNKKDNWKLMLELEGAKLYFRMKSDNSIRELWGEIVKEINEIMILNSIQMTKNDQDKTLNIFEQIRNAKNDK
jgi:hypothetical protein